MALWMAYQLETQDVDLVVTIGWRTTQNGPVIHTDIFRYNLTDRAVIGDGAQALADMIVRDVKQRARVINDGVTVYAGVSAALTVPEGVVVQII